MWFLTDTRSVQQCSSLIDMIEYFFYFLFFLNFVFGRAWFNTGRWFKELVEKLGQIFPQLDNRIIKDVARPVAERLQQVFGRERGVGRFSSTPPLRANNCLGNMDFVEPDTPETEGKIKLKFICLFIYLFILIRL